MTRPTAPMASRSNTAASSTSQVSTASNQTHGFRNQFGSLLPRHALFQVQLSIEELSNVPLVKGQFGVRWKFKNVQSGSGLLAKMKNGSGGRSTTGSSLTPRVDKKGKGRAGDLKVIVDDIAARAENSDTEGEYHSADGDSVSWDAGQDIPRSASPTTLDAPYTASPEATPDLPASAAPTIKVSSTLRPIHTPHLHSEPKGITDWQSLRSFNAKWNHKVNVVVQMDVHRETGDLLPNTLKLVVMQRVIQGDVDAPQHPRLGAVYLNLAEYADASTVTRRYLLRESKTNATLKVTLNLTHIGGVKDYRPPPLRKGEIMADVSGLLSNNDLLSTRLARTLDLYTREEDDTSSIKRSNSLPHPYSNDDGHVDFDRLATINGLHTTESLIEAIFNPVPTMSTVPSPFTVYDPTKARELEVDIAASSKHSSLTSATSTSSDSKQNGNGAGSGRTPSLYAGSEHSSVSGSDHHDGQKQHWWQKMSRSSRPGTPVTRQHRPSTPKLPLLDNHRTFSKSSTLSSTASQ